MTKTTDTLFAHPMGAVEGFTFDETVASVFPDMIQRSVPGYSTVVAISGILAERFSQPGSNLYDLGCSLGATSFSMAQHCAESCRIFAVDSSTAMLDSLRETLANQSLSNQSSTNQSLSNQSLTNQSQLAPIELVHGDICDVPINNASVVALNYTLQFVDVVKRPKLLRKIQQGMIDGGVLILSEKIHFESSGVDSLFVDLHHEFKRANGYSELEISQKREAIENVLVPETLEAHRQRLSACGFQRVEVWFQCFNFVSLVAFK